ncbi:AAA family ATPase [Hymenobacter volaticus]|uniref:AAA family ATPase n=1 Tax=Hymenobacter volaticus TaxID=2932254 RepID=A0ABY4GF13_9BACT|nr:AAA family ATPase [Hymenobacter volaticus]UOQ69468.1 AAA family ATPase [Hymenobacter volaticus]
MPHRIKELKLTHFRGATRPVTVQFDPNKRIVVIFGENGTGKSTLVDAIDAVGNASFGSLDREGVRPNPHKYVSSVNQTVKTLEVELTTAVGHRWKATISGKNVSVTPVAPDGILPGVLVLRRRELLKLIETQPAKRYEAIKSFIDVAEVDKAEAALRNDMNAAEKQLTSANAAREQAEKSLRVMWEQEKQPDEIAAEPIAWADQRRAENVAVLEQQAQQMASLLATAQSLTDAVGAWHRAHDARRSWADQLQHAEAELAASSQSEDTLRAELIRLLNTAKAYLASPAAPTSCPLCASAVQADSLREHVEAQLQALQHVDALLREVASRQAEHKHAEGECVLCNRQVSRQLQQLVSQVAEQGPIEVRALGIDWAQLQRDLASNDAGDTLTEQAAAVAQQLEEARPTIQQALESLRQRLTLRENILAQASLLKDSTEQAAALGRVVERLTRACQLVVDTRREFVQTILDGIIEEVNRLFAVIHPDEKIGLHRLEMDEVKRTSLEQHARFQDAAEVIPQAYFSESHLDTFGFCLWLALAKRLTPSRLVLVLDDVFTSVDTPHFQRISNLLADEAQHFQQLIIATHNRRWQEIYKHNSAGVHLLKLEEWTLSRGLRPYEDHTLLAELATTLASEPFNRQAVASQAGIILENLLDNVALVYGCRLPRKHGNSYTLGELLISTRKLLQKAVVRRLDRDAHGHPLLPNQWSVLPLADLFQTIDGLTFIRNEVGAHFNSAGADTSDRDIRTFGEAVLAFAQRLACPTCGHMPQKEKDDHRSCRCPKHQTQLRPLTWR